VVIGWRRDLGDDTKRDCVVRTLTYAPFDQRFSAQF